MKTKSNIFQKTTAAMVFFVLFVSTTGFINNKTETQKYDYYFFLEFKPGSSSEYSTTRYITSVIYYGGDESCGKSYDFERKAQDAFENYIKANYNESYLRHNMTYSQKVNSTEKIKTTQQAREKLDSYLAEQKAKGNKVIQTTFSYSCN